MFSNYYKFSLPLNISVANGPYTSKSLHSENVADVINFFMFPKSDIKISLNLT
jgi:hypothetical protein